MRKLIPFVPRAWTLPFIVAGLAVPIVAAFAIGPQLGLAAGALAVGTLLVVAARTRYDEPIEVVARHDDRYRLLVVVTRELGEPAAMEQLADAASGERRPEVLVLAPAVGSALDRWASDVGATRAAAQSRLVVSLAKLAAAGLDARGSVGDADTVQAVEDALRTFPAQEIALLPGPELGGEEIETIRRRLDRPVRLLA